MTTCALSGRKVEFEKILIHLKASLTLWICFVVAQKRSFGKVVRKMNCAVASYKIASSAKKSISPKLKVHNNSSLGLIISTTLDDWSDILATWQQALAKKNRVSPKLKTAKFLIEDDVSS